MADPRFFDREGPFTLDSLAALSGARLVRPESGSRLFRDVAPLETAGPEDVSFLENRKYLEAFVHSRGRSGFCRRKVGGTGAASDGAPSKQRTLQGLCSCCAGLLPRASGDTPQSTVGPDRSGGVRAGGLRGRPKHGHRAWGTSRATLPNRRELGDRSRGRDWRRLSNRRQCHTQSLSDRIARRATPRRA